MAVRPSAFWCGANVSRAVRFLTLFVRVSGISKLFVFGRERLEIYRTAGARVVPQVSGDGVGCHV
jgi:hypothetical protein